MSFPSLFFGEFPLIFFVSVSRRLGWDAREGEGHLDMMLRGELLVALAELGHDVTQDEALRRFIVYLDDRNTSLLPPDIRKVYLQKQTYISLPHEYLLI